MKRQLRYCLRGILVCAVLAAVTRAQGSELEPKRWTKMGHEMLPTFTLKQLEPANMIVAGYPPKERAAKVQGRAIIYVVVDTKGKVEKAVVKESVPVPSFGESARSAVIKWQFQIIKKEGKPIRYLIHVPWTFRIE